MPLLTREQIKHERMRSMAHTFGRADTTLARRRVTVTVEDNPQVDAPAFSIGDAITLNVGKIGDVDTTDDIIKVTGLNFHELAHAEYTPRDDKVGLVKDLADEGLFRYFNMLEDQRIETLLSAKYAAMKPYFTMTIMRYIAGDDSDLTTAHALTYGRKFLPAAIRQGLRDAWKFPKQLKRLENIIDEFRTLTFPTDNDRGLRLTRELRDLLNEATGHDQQQQPGCPYGHSTEQGDSGARPDGERTQRWNEPKPSEQKQKDAQDQRDKQEAQSNGSGDDDSDDDTDEQDGDGDADGGDDGEQDGQGDKGDKSKGQGKGGDNGDEDSDEEGDQDGEGEKAGRGNSQAPSVVDPQALKDLAKKVADKAASTPDVQNDAKRKRDAMKRMDGSIPELDLMRYAEDDPELDFINARNGFKRQLLKLWADADPGYHTHKSSGKVNIGRAMRGDDFDTVFDQWDAGKNDVTDIELVILADYSSSMKYHMSQVSQAIWAIKGAVETVKGEVTVIGFADNAQTFYTKGDKSQRAKVRHFGASGGTQPWEAIKELRKMMHFSKKAHRIAIFLTDGEWDDVDSSRHGYYASRGPNAPYGQPSHEETIRALNADGVVTALAYLGNGTTIRNTHDCQIAHVIHTPGELVTLAQQIVKQAMSN